jgi:hypothetical protein
VPNFFRANISAPMGARAVSLFLRHSKWQKFYAIGMGYAWGHMAGDDFNAFLAQAARYKLPEKVQMLTRLGLPRAEAATEQLRSRRVDNAARQS